MVTVDELQALAYRELQAEAKRLGLKASGTKADIIERILAQQQEPDAPEPAGEPAASPRKPQEPAAAKTPRTSRTPRAAKTPAVTIAELEQEEEDAEEEGGPTAPQAPSTSTKTPAAGGSSGAGRAVLAAAAATPLPQSPPQEPSDDEGDDVEDEDKDAGGNHGGGGNAAREANMPAPQRRRSPASGGATWGGKLLQLLLTAALLAAGAALLVPWCEQRHCVERLQAALPPQLVVQLGKLQEPLAQLQQHVLLLPPPVVQDALAQVYAQGVEVAQRSLDRAGTLYDVARGHALTFSDAVVAHTRQLVVAIWPSSHGSSSGVCSGVSPDVLATLVPVGEEWEALREVAESLLAADNEGSPPSQASPVKANSLLLACSTAEVCNSAQQALADAADGGCLLRVDAGASGSGGALQKQLASFLARHPNGTVLLQRLDQLPREALPVLVSALSEGGHFTEGGSPVPATGATFLLTMLMPEDVVGQERAANFTVQAKAQLAVALAEMGGGGEDARGVAAALRRRVDTVLPLA